MKPALLKNIKLPTQEELLKWKGFLSGLPKWLKILLGLLLVLTIVFSFMLSGVPDKERQLNSQIAEKTKAIEKLRAENLQIKARSIELAKEAEPFEQVAQKRYPNMELQDALDSLLKDFQVSQKLAVQYDYASLSDGKQQLILEKLKQISGKFDGNLKRIEFTYEIWVSSAAKKFLEELASLLTQAGFQVAGPDLAIVYVEKQPSAPVEWEYSIKDEDLVWELRQALDPLISSDSKYAKRYSGTQGKLKIHFAGHVKFAVDGAVTLY